MALTVHLDLIETLSLRETDGVVVGVTRAVMIEGFTDSDLGILDTCLAELDTQGLTVGSVPTDYPSTMLQGRDPAVLPIDNRKVKTILTYVHFTEFTGQDLLGVPVHFEKDSELEQLRTNLDSLVGGAPIQLSYQYPADHPTRPSQLVLQGGEIDALVPRDTLVAKGLIATDAPKLYTVFLGQLNAIPWGGGGARTWMCTKAKHRHFAKIAAPNPDKWHFDFEFQHKEEGWDPTAVFVDPITNRTPADIEVAPNPGNASKTITYQPDRNFGYLFIPPPGI